MHIYNTAAVSWKLYHVHMYVCTHLQYVCMYVRMLNKNTLGVKKCKANLKQHAKRQVQPKALISVEAKKLATLSKNF